MAALQCEHELALLHLLEADRARVVERLRERLPVAKLRQPVRGGALLVRVRVRVRARVRVKVGQDANQCEVGGVLLQCDRLSLPLLGACRAEARRVARVLSCACPPGWG